MADNSFFSLSPQIELLPVIYGSVEVAREVRNRILNNKFDCLAVPLPPSFEEEILKGLALLPRITLVLQEENLPDSEDSDEEPPPRQFNYVPLDPCQPLIMGLRVARQENIPVKFIDREVEEFLPSPSIFPDAHALTKVSLEKFSAAMLPAISRPLINSQQDLRVRHMARQLREMEVDYRKILFLCSLHDWPWIREAYRQRFFSLGAGQITPNPARLQAVARNSLYFILGELPFLTGLYEKKREELLSDRNLSIDGIKELVLEARERWLKKYELKKEEHWLTLTRLQILIHYVRNLSLLEKRMTPDLYSLAVAAKQIGGDSFAITLLETARDYDYQEEAAFSENIEVGLGEACLAGDEVVRVKNRLAGTALSWRSLKLNPAPERQKQKAWEHLWNPHGQCSWPVEDTRIESFNLHVREQAKAIIGEDLVRSEKFTTSVKDGIDLRETLRHWYDGKIYVKEIPPNRGSIDAVVFIFEMEAVMQKYGWRQTWYAEHAAESTLCFYATPYMENIIGPGIAQSTYGGCFLLFPAQVIRNIWDDPRFEYARSLEERLIAAAGFYSREKHIVIVSPRPLLARWKKVARNYGKNPVYIPLKRFSAQTIAKLRRFHVLNGKQVRSYAAKFIREF